MKIKRVMIAAPKSGSGKTIVTCALLQVLKEHGLRAVSFKCGPDYIDPMFHEKILKIPAKNLDTYFTDEETTNMLFLDGLGKSDVAVIEGVMGLYDGVGGVREEGSSYHLAKVTKTPIVLVVDAKGTGRSVIPLIAGFLSYDREKLIRGVILNCSSKGYYETVKPLIEEELGITVLGFLPGNQQFHIESRHLGLLLPDEGIRLRERMEEASLLFSQTVSVELLMQIAGSADDMKFSSMGKKKADSKNKPVIAVAKDKAFCFYYTDNIRMLEEYGAEIKYFSPLFDEKLPEPCHGLLLGGGYPELYAEQLSRNLTMKDSIRNALKNKIPAVAECGGFLYLHSALKDGNGIWHEMAGAIPAACYNTGKLVRFGYIALREKQSCFLPEGEIIKGHEFHYYESTQNGEDVRAVKPMTGKEYACVIENETQWMGFPHLYYPSNPFFAKRFVEKAVQYRKMEGGSNML